MATAKPLLANAQFKENRMRMAPIVVAALSLIASAQAQKQAKAKGGNASTATVIEAKIHQAWDAFKNKNKDQYAVLMADDFQEAEEDGKGFRNKDAELAEIGEYGLADYKLSDLKVKPLGSQAALVTYRAEYSGSAEGQSYNNKSVIGEVWVKQGKDWKILHVQETKVQ